MELVPRFLLVFQPHASKYFPMLRFPALDALPVDYAFTLRELEGATTTADAVATLARHGFPCPLWVQAGQTHGNGVAAVGVMDDHTVIPEVDALATDVPGLTLIIRVADCGPVFFVDPERRAIALAHSGRKGTEAAIVTATLEKMRRSLGSDPRDVVVLLGPCIRPPHYEVDFASTILDQARSAGVAAVHDCGLNTGADLERFYSYRMEKGATGRHYAALRLKK
jgi:copper oxidase (laccase) domain-containing protein